MRKPTLWFPTRSDTNRAVEPQYIARSLKEEGLYYPCNENKGADQLPGYHQADLCLYLRIYANCWFPMRQLNIMSGNFEMTGAWKP